MIDLKDSNRLTIHSEAVAFLDPQPGPRRTAEIAVLHILLLIRRFRGRCGGSVEPCHNRLPNMQISRMTIPVNDSKNMMRLEVPDASPWACLRTSAS